MDRAIRFALFSLGMVTLTLALGFATRQPWAINLWPWADSRLSYIFLGSIAAAVATPILWIAATGELRAAAPGALNLIVSFGGAAVTLGWLVVRHGTARLLITALAFALATLANLAIWSWSRRQPPRDRRSLPLPVRASFGLFAALLVPVGLALVLRAPHIFPWPLPPESSSIFGWIFLGASLYFLHGLLRPSWANAAGQLLGFLAYDLVLIGPFLGHFASVQSEHRVSLIVYTAVLIYSGILATYYLFLHPATRFRFGPGGNLLPPRSTL